MAINKIEQSTIGGGGRQGAYGWGGMGVREGGGDDEPGESKGIEFPQPLCVLTP